ncbi:MAG: DUF3685 domain-containing protein [Drouetiella hepatica Uher 2000/2452]|jgi:DNA-binding NarL/FixJ family response regulator|uniref:DUF3685 domain-containing protein n=1 Tax=Drouetiella hepatica Uher 2000/2452 TaxID=904376 RepID=A0A951UME3_9CYAN|nr:DUF3685 domain-containing protein [Drouetiella hepatica Uher 2000/2452]
MSLVQAAIRHPYRLMLIDEDPVFRLGLRVWLERYADLSLIAEVETGEAALEYLEDALSDSLERSSVEHPSESGAIALAVPDLVVLEMELGRSHPDRIPGLTLCQHLKTKYPTLRVLMLSASPEPLLSAAAQQAGATGYCPKTVEPESLANILRRVADGRSFFWNAASTSYSPLPTAPTPYLPSSHLSSPRRPAPLSRFRRNLRQSGLQQIEAALAEVNAELRQLELSLVDRAILAGRQRELRAARKLIGWMLATPSLTEERARQPVSSQGTGSQFINSQITGSQITGSQGAGSQITNRSGGEERSLPTASALTINASSESAISKMRIESVLFDAVLEKLHNSLENGTETPMEIDILREEKKRELFYLILRQLENFLDELRYSEVQPEQLEPKRSSILLDLWQAVTTEFFGKYYAIAVDGKSVEVVETLLRDEAIVQLEILDKIPSVVDLLKHLLFQMPLAVDSVPYAPGNPEAMSRAEVLTENLLIQLANAVIQPLLNRFASIEGIKQNLYSRKLLSNREIERFRNDLSWKYRIEKYFREPQNIFESQYSIHVFSWKGIQKTSIYAPRSPELNELSGVQLAVTLALETRDAIAPRLRTAVSWAGNSVIYVLTEVVGRGLGLVGRGILKGLGNAWQDPRLKR